MKFSLQISLLTQIFPNITFYNLCLYAQILSISFSSVSWMQTASLLSECNMRLINYHFPNFLNNFLLIVTIRRASTAHIGTINILRFVWTADTTDARHFDMTVRVCFLHPVPCILKPFIPICFGLLGIPRYFIPSHGK